MVLQKFIFKITISYSKELRILTKKTEVCIVIKHSLSSVSSRIRIRQVEHMVRQATT